MKRAFVVVLDACGVGALPDAADYGDAGANTLGHLAEVLGGLDLPVLGGLGLGSILSLEGVPPSPAPALHGRLHALGAGKDSTAGHRELMGLVAHQPPPVYPGGFPPEIIELVRTISGRAILCNRTSNGIEAIDTFGAESLSTGALIVYTSQDSVLQIAAHRDAIAPEELYRVCVEVRAGLGDAHPIGRVIARPFSGVAGAFNRTEGRHDYALVPSAPSYLDALTGAGVSVHGVGKVAQLFAGRGFAAEHHGATNAQALAATGELIDTLDTGVVFTNLVETDQLYGHRHDAPGFAGALEEIDATLGGWLNALRAEDLLILTADHGVDVTAPHTDHTREYVPLLAVFPGHDGRRHDGPLSDVGASVLRWMTGEATSALPGHPFL